MSKKYTIVLIGAVTGLVLILALLTISNNKVNRYPLVDTDTDAEAAGSPELFSEELVQSLNEKFEIIQKKGDVAYSPKQFLSQKKGGEIDFAVYIASELKAQGFQTVVLRYQYEDGQKRGINTVVVFGDIDAPKYIYIEQGKLKMIAHGKSFEDLFRLEEARLGIMITGVAVFEPGTLNLKVEQWERR